MLLKILFLLACLWGISEPSKVFKCTGITYNANFTDCTTNEIILSTNFDMNIELDSQNHLYPNILTYSNFSSSLFNNSYNINVNDFRIGQWAVGYHYEWNPNRYPNYTVNYPNVFSAQILDYFSYDGISVSVILFYINDGEIIAENGSFLDDSCAQEEDLMWCNDNPRNFMITETVCCNKYENVDIPHSLDDVCEEYKSETIITENDINITYISANYYINDIGIIISVRNFTSLAYVSYELIATSLQELHKDEACEGDGSSPIKKFCLKPFPSNDFQFNFQFVLNTAEDIYHFNPIVGKIQRRNGIFLKDNYQPFTKENPCWSEAGAVPFYSDLMDNKSFCCTKFKNIPTSSSTSFPATTASNNGVCKKYQSKTELSDGSIYLEVEYMLNSTGIIADITNYFTSNKATAQLEVYSADTFSEVCRVTPKNPTNKCFFDLSQNHQYQLQVRTSSMPEGFNMTTLIENNGQFVMPFLTPSTPCEDESHPYNYESSPIFATTKFCCTAFN